MKSFILPIIVSGIILSGVFFTLGPAAFVTALLLTILEVTLSFDNAVVNAKVLTKMSDAWRKRFLTWGIIVAVFGTRLVLPILIVSATAWISPLAVTSLAFFSPETYAHLLEGARYSIHAFGGAFLFMVALKYFFDSSKKVHWLKSIERHFAGWGRIEAIEIAIVLIVLAALSFVVPTHEQAPVLAAGIIGVVLFIVMQGLANAFSMKTDLSTTGLSLFIYLNILDAAFSLDGVVGAFALTTSIPVIVVGLGIGAYFVRSLTLYLVEKKTLDTLIYLEHGAHWAIAGLALVLFTDLFFQIPAVITGLIGIAFVLAAYWSSKKLGTSKEPL